MKTNVVIAEEDLNFHKIIHDILEISFSDVAIDRAMNGESLLEKLEHSEEPYHLILYNFHFDEESGVNALKELREKKPELDPRILILLESEDEFKSKTIQGLRHILKPFSLDEFAEIVKDICATAKE